MGRLRAIVGVLLVSASTCLHVLPLLAAALVKAMVRIAPVRRSCDRLLIGIAENWIGVNTFLLRTCTHTYIDVRSSDIDVRSSEALTLKGRYLVLCNHQSWVDIPVLQAVFNRKIPFLRFFLKSELIWVPLLGLAWWALDFPFMKRHSRAAIARCPKLAGEDIETTRRACEKFQGIPISILNFPEGTRLTLLKHASQKSPYRRLLKPKAGGVALVLETMKGGLDGILDVTVSYPEGSPSIADLFADRVREVRVDITRCDIPARLAQGDYAKDPAAQDEIRAFLNDLWAAKDARLSSMRDAK